MFTFVLFILYLKFLGPTMKEALNNLVFSQENLRLTLRTSLQLMTCLGFASHVLNYLHVIKYFNDGVGMNPLSSTVHFLNIINDNATGLFVILVMFGYRYGRLSNQ